MENKDELIKLGKCWKKLKKSLEELIESDYAENKEIYELMLQLMIAEEQEIGE